MVQSTDMATTNPVRREKKKKTPDQLIRAASHKSAGEAQKLLPPHLQSTKLRLKSFREIAKEIATGITGRSPIEYPHLDNCTNELRVVYDRLKKYNLALAKCIKANKIKMPRSKTAKYLNELITTANNAKSRIDCVVANSRYASEGYPHKEKSNEMPLEERIFNELVCLWSAYHSTMTIDRVKKRFSILTEPITLHGTGERYLDEAGTSVHFGKMRMFVVWFSGYPGIGVGPESPETMVVNGYSFPHPHVNEYRSETGYGKLCRGEGGMAIDAAMKAGRLSDVIANIESILTMYNENSPYARLKNFFTSAETKGLYSGPPIVREPVFIACPSCRHSVQDTNFSRLACHCGYINCNNCTTTCTSNSHRDAVTLCSNCSWTCSCGGVYCNHNHVVGRCSHRNCTNKMCGQGTCIKRSTCCNKVFCSTHILKCKTCPKLLCLEHNVGEYCTDCAKKSRCASCAEEFSPTGSVVCVCDNPVKVCLRCTIACQGCQRLLCDQCNLYCIVCQVPYCSRCLHSPWVCGPCVISEAERVAAEIAEANGEPPLIPDYAAIAAREDEEENEDEEVIEDSDEEEDEDEDQDEDHEENDDEADIVVAQDPIITPENVINAGENFNDIIGVPGSPAIDVGAGLSPPVLPTANTVMLESIAGRLTTIRRWPVVDEFGNITIREEVIPQPITTEGEPHGESEPPSAAQGEAGVLPRTEATEARRPIFLAEGTYQYQAPRIDWGRAGGVTFEARARQEPQGEFVSDDEPTETNIMFWSAADGAANDFESRHQRWQSFRSNQGV